MSTNSELELCDASATTSRSSLPWSRTSRQKNLAWPTSTIPRALASVSSPHAVGGGSDTVACYTIQPFRYDATNTTLLMPDCIDGTDPAQGLWVLDDGYEDA